MGKVKEEHDDSNKSKTKSANHARKKDGKQMIRNLCYNALILATTVRGVRRA